MNSTGVPRTKSGASQQYPPPSQASSPPQSQVYPQNVTNSPSTTRSVKKTRKKGVGAGRGEITGPRTKREKSYDETEQQYYPENEYSQTSVDQDDEPESETTDGVADDVGGGGGRGRPKTRASTRKKKDDKRASVPTIGPGGSSAAGTRETRGSEGRNTNEAVAAEIAATAEETEEAKDASYGAYPGNFWKTISEYFMPFTKQNLDFCLNTNHGLPEGSSLLEIPPVGLHYKEIWYQQDQAEMEGTNFIGSSSTVDVDGDDNYGLDDGVGQTE